MAKKPKDPKAGGFTVIGRKRITPIDGLTEGERFVWIRMVNACSAEHFNQSDIPLMVMYCQTFVQEQKAMDQMKNSPFVERKTNLDLAPHPIIAIHKSLAGTMSNLAMRLRLAPSTRIQTTNKAIGSDTPPSLETEGDEIDSLFAKPTLVKK